MPGDNPAVVLLVEDDRTTRIVTAGWLSQAGFRIEEAESAEQALERLSEVVPDVILLDLELPGMSGREALEIILQRNPGLPVVIATADSEVQTVVKAMQLGAYDFLTKPVDRTRLLTTVANASSARAMQLKVQALQRDAKVTSSYGILGDSEPMRSLFSQIDRVAATDVTVVIRGESGTGKELIARAIHAASPRAHLPLVSVNCAAVAESLQESEFFGHERGAFTGAVTQKKGFFEAANKGTLFLDEVGELSLGLQAKLLRVLQERVFQRVGGGSELRSDFRLVSATHRDLLQFVHQGKFREDLFHRIAVFEIQVAPLREREGDIELIATSIVQRSTTQPIEIGEDAMQVLRSYRWPGNVRELHNALQHALVLVRNNKIRAADLPARIREPEPPPPPSYDDRRSWPDTPRQQVVIEDKKATTGENRSMSLEEAERIALQTALETTRWNVTETARLLGIGRTTAYRLMKRFGLKP